MLRGRNFDLTGLEFSREDWFPLQGSDEFARMLVCFPGRAMSNRGPAVTENPNTVEQMVKRESLATQFWRLGWLGFWIQITLLIVPILLLVYVLFLGRPDSGGPMGIDLSNYLSYGSLLVLAFTTLWFFRYTRLGKRIADGDSAPSLASVERTLWVGVWASCLGILFSIVLKFSAIGRLLFVLLATPQTGLQIAPALGDNPVKSLSAVDAVSLMVLLVILVAELIVLGLSLWLLFRTTRLAVKESGAEA